MKNRNVRRGFTQIVVKNQVILNLIQDLQRLLLSFVNGVRGRSRIKYGMTVLFNNGGFTLIELLVVVLIIGILAAVAVPQYQFAVEKSRTAEALVQLNSLQRAIDSYLLENGYPESLESFLGNQTDGNGKLVIDVTGSLDCTVNDGQLCASRDFLYKSICDGEHNSCFLEAQRVLSGYEYTDSNTKYLLALSKTQDTWTKRCYYIEEHYPQGKKLCDSLQTQGWISEEF